MKKSSNTPKECLSCNWFCKAEKIYDTFLLDRCFIFCLITNNIREAFKRCKGISYDLNSKEKK